MFADVVSLKIKPGSFRHGSAETVDIAPLLSLGGQNRRSGTGHNPTSRNLLSAKSASKAIQPGSGLFILRRKTRPSPRELSGFGRGYNPVFRNGYGVDIDNDFLFQQNRRSQTTGASRYAPLLNSYQTKPSSWVALQNALQRQQAMKSLYHGGAARPSGKSQYHQSLLPLLHHYKLQKNAADKYYDKYLRTLQLLALATSIQKSIDPTSPELSSYTHSFQNSPYSSLLSNSSFVITNSVGSIEIHTNNITSSEINRNNSSKVSDQIAEASGRIDYGEPHDEISSFHRELENQQRRLLEVFPPPQSEIPFGERTILMVRFPPVPEQKKKEFIKLSTTYDIDGGITFGGPRWLSFGTPFDPWDHPWNHEPPKEKVHTRLVYAEADKASSYGVIISQNFVYRPSIRFTNTDPKLLAKNQGDLLNGGPSIVAQLAKALAEGNRITNSYYLSKNLLQGKQWASPAKKPPFVIVHLDTYTKKKNETKAFGLNDDVEANYANGTIIYPTQNNPNILASTKFEFHNAHEIDQIFDKPLAILGHGYGWGDVPVHPKGIREIRNFMQLMYKVHQEAHGAGRTKVDDLRKLGDELQRPAFNDSKPLLRDQIADRSVNWLHTSSVGIRSLSEYDDQFPYAKHPVVDVSKDYY